MPKKAVEYKKPRKINVVSVSLFLSLGFGIYMGTQYANLFFIKQEAARALEATSSRFHRSPKAYLSDPKIRLNLENFMKAELSRSGISSPDDVWIEAEGKEVFFGVQYTRELHWPFAMVKPTTQVYEAEHVVVMP